MHRELLVCGADAGLQGGWEIFVGVGNERHTVDVCDKTDTDAIFVYFLRLIVPTRQIFRAQFSHANP